MEFIFEFLTELVTDILGSIVKDKDTGNTAKFISIMILVIPVLVICGFVTYSGIKMFASDKLTAIILFAVVFFLIGMCIYAIIYNMKKK